MIQLVIVIVHVIVDVMVFDCLVVWLLLAWWWWSMYLVVVLE